MAGSTAQLIPYLIANPEVSGSNLSHITSAEIDHEIFSTVILPFPLIQEGQLSVTGESMCTSTG